MDCKVIGQRIRQVRKANGLTQEKLAEMLELTEKYLGNLESGKDRPALATLVRFANLFDLSLDYLLGENLNYVKLTAGVGTTELFGELTESISKMDDKDRKIMVDFCNYLHEVRNDLLHN